MLNRIIRFSLNNRLAVLLCSVLLILAGAYQSSRMEVDVFPDLNAPTVVVMTEAKGMAAEEVERLVSFPIETAVNGATDVRRVRSSSTTGFSVVWVEFDWGTDIYRARQIVSEKLAAITDQLPQNAGSPTLGPQSSILGELMIIGLTSDSTSMQQLRTLADALLRPRLLSLGGVAQVTVLGGDIKEYQVLVHPEKMRHYGVGLNELMEALQDMNRNVAGGTLYEYGNEYIVRGLLSTNCADSLKRAVVKRTAGGRAITLQSVAEVKTGAQTPKLGCASTKGKDAVLLTVTKQPATNTLDLTERLDKTLAELQSSLPADVKVSTDLFRQANFINSSIGNVQKSLFEGVLFVVIVLFLFLMNTRTTLISLVTIPLSILITLLTLQTLGHTINTMSLGGIAIAIGSLVDDAIVDVENVFKRLRENRLLPKEERRDVVTVVFQASQEVRIPILNSTLIIVASFLPLFFLSGMEGRMLIPLGIAFIISLFASTLVALTLTPVLCSYLLGRQGSDRAGKEPAWVSGMKKVYARLLESALRHPRKILGATLLLFVACLFLFFSFGRSFLPPFNAGSFTINVNTLPGVSLETSDRIGRQAEELLLQVPEIITTGRKTGRAELDEHALGINTSEIEAPFRLADRSKDEVMADIRQRLSKLPGVSVEIGAPISHRIDAMLSGTKANIAIKLFGTDLKTMYSLGQEIKEAIENVEGVADLNVEQQVETPQLQIIPRREMLAQYGLTLPEFSRSVEALLGGATLSSVYEGNQTVDITLRLDDDHRNNLSTLRTMVIQAGDRLIPLENVARVVSTSGPNSISRENASRKLVISANVAGRDLRGVVNDIRKEIGEKVTLPTGYHLEYGGQFENEQAASRTILMTSLLSLLIIFMLLFHEFKSLRLSAIVMVGLPLALIGGVVSIALTGYVCSIPSVIGFISLLGIATRGGLLLIERYERLRTAEGLSLQASIVRGSTDRLNPILMTALSSALALVPIALGGDLPGNEIQSPMAKVILGGLLSSTLLNAFVVPLLYSLIYPKTYRHDK